MQKNRDQYRAVLQLESDKNPMQQHAGTFILLLITPKLYANDGMKIANNTDILGFCTGHDVRFDLRTDLEKSVALSNYVISIVDNADNGEVIFHK